MSTTTLPLAPPRAVAKPVEQSWVPIIVGLMVAHAFLPLVIRSLPFLGTAHALGVAAGGMVYAATTKTVRNIAPVLTYIVGCEVLWRMTKVSPLWEYGKYACLGVLFVALARIQWRRNRMLACAYFGLLLPSVALTVLALPLGRAREELSFCLSGPLLIAIAVVFFSNVTITVEQLRASLLALIAPAIGIAVLCYVATTSARVEFVNASNDNVSFGFGANQVSAALGLATMFTLFLAFERRLPWRLRVPLIVVAILLAAQAVLTFSRGGVVLALAGTVAALFFLMRGSSRARLGIALVSITLSLVGRFVVKPQLDEFTGGRLATRYTDTRSSGRNAIVDSEIAMFKDSPVFGHGPGMGGWYRAENDLRIGASHTEYTRMLGEHGLFGILSLACLVGLCVRAIRGAKPIANRAFASAFVVWTVLFLAVNGTRLAAPALVLGLAFALRAPATPLPVARRA